MYVDFLFFFAKIIDVSAGTISFWLVLEFILQYIKRTIAMQELSLNELCEVAGGFSVRGIAPSPMPTPAPIEVGQAAIAHVGPTTTSWLDGWLGSTGITKPPLQVRYN